MQMLATRPLPGEWPPLETFVLDEIPTPLPSHRNTLDPQWLRAWARFENVTTPLRERGLACDVDHGLDDWLIYARPAGHDSAFLIGSDGGWLVTHQAPADAPSSLTVVYDSRTEPDVAPAQHVPSLLAAIDVHLAQLTRRTPTTQPALPARATTTAQTSHAGVTTTPNPSVPRTDYPHGKRR
ncbi:hypothetical protein [Streptomyces sp. NPDC048340]|uniref:hypothetical protein n=1 Tax=Streptomyces sp. NPDC048340 TaxID=3365537 RepID=UPI00372423D3